MEILILGGTGAIGNYLVDILADNTNYEIYVTSRKQRNTVYPNVHYLVGNARDDAFLYSVIENKRFNAIVDFMSYKTKQFQGRLGALLKSTDQYIFLSSSRVYADSGSLITEESAVLLNTLDDEVYLNTDEYALTKARQEQLLNQSGKTNYTIIRPYITYSNERLQLGILEKEMWLYRVLRGHSIVFGKDLSQHTTTLTFGADVAGGIASIIGNKEAYGETYHITQENTLTWNDVLKLYCDVISEETGKNPNVSWREDSFGMAMILGRKYQLLYDRIYDRCFDNSKIKTMYPNITKAQIPQEGLRKCLKELIRNGSSWRYIDWKYEGWADKVSNEYTPLKEMAGLKNKIKYFLARYSCYFEITRRNK